DGIGGEENVYDGIEMLHKSADLGCVLAQERLSICYYHGSNVGKNESEAEKFARNCRTERV
ncbi:MAG: hypothetical protein Q4C96_07960, partial [Planctomycetia bacterium]|nr:hypothetical protein [Planctomycetia bacterium]